jgi:hypothetical protein
MSKSGKETVELVERLASAKSARTRGVERLSSAKAARTRGVANCSKRLS